jgi:oxygen-dependent protoporphyrinogen oxidase
MVSGIFAGDPETMSLKSCFPRIAELESEYGSLIMAMIKLAKKKKEESAAGKAVSSAAGPGGVLTSFRGGIQTLTDILAEKLGNAVVPGQAALKISKAGNSRYRVVTESGEMEADIVVLATPADVSAGLLPELDTFINHVLQTIPYASLTVVCYGYERAKIRHDLNGFGYLMPKEERMNTLGTLWDSSIFAQRAPAGKVLLRSMMGGASFPKYIHLSDAEVNNRVQDDLKKILGIKALPSFIRIFRHEKAIPQYTVGHGERLSNLTEKLKEHPGLYLTGNAYRGIGLNDCVAAADRCSRDAVLYLKRL